MKCPLCEQPIHEGAEHCPHCDGDAQHLADLYHNQPSTVKMLHDGAGILKVSERRAAERWIQKFSREFPGCFLTIHSVDLNDKQNVASYGIWALNIPRYTDLPESAFRDAGVCLVLDVHKKEVALNYGYQLEPHLSAEACFSAIAPAHPYLLDNAYIEAIELMRHGVRKMMRGRSRWAKTTLRRKKLTDRIIFK